MTTRWRFLLVLIAVAACDRDPRQTLAPATSPSIEALPATVLAPAAAAAGLPPVAPRRLSAEEERLLAEIETLVPAEVGRQLRESLLDPRAGDLTLHGHPAVQQRLDRIAAIRRAARASADSSAAQRGYYPVTVALLDRLPMPDARAVVLRRTSRQPADVILLTRADASVESLGAAFSALMTLRKRDGDRASRDVVVRVAGGKMPASWRRTGLDAAASELLAQLRASTPQEIAGVGSVPAVEMPVAGTAASQR